MGRASPGWRVFIEAPLRKPLSFRVIFTDISQPHATPRDGARPEQSRGGGGPCGCTRGVPVCPGRRGACGAPGHWGCYAPRASGFLRASGCRGPSYRGPGCRGPGYVASARGPWTFVLSWGTPRRKAHGWCSSFVKASLIHSAGACLGGNVSPTRDGAASTNSG